jgi:thioredoxin reductase (NADPH)
MGEREYSQMMGPMQQSSAKIKLFGTGNLPPAYSIRDFLQRSVVAFDWIELQNDEEELPPSN